MRDDLLRCAGAGTHRCRCIPKGREEGSDPRKPKIPKEYRSAPDQGATANADQSPPDKLADAALAPDTKEPQPGQNAGTIAPGFLENLSQLFTDQKETEVGWSADVEINDPADKSDLMAAPVMKPVAANKPMSEKLTPRQQTAALNPPAGNNGDAWTTTVEMNTDTGDPMVLQVTKSPVPAGDLAPPSQLAQSQVPSQDLINPLVAPRKPAKADTPSAGLARGNQVAELPKASASDDPLGDLPPAEGEESDLPLAEGEASDLPPLDSDNSDLPPAEGEQADDLPPAEGEESESVKAAAKPTPRKPPKKLPYSDPLRAPDPIPARDQPVTPARALSRTAEFKTGPEDPIGRRSDLRLQPDEQLATPGRTRYPTVGEVAAKQQSRSAALWPVTKLAKNDIAPARTAARPRPAMLGRTSLTGAILSLGESVSLESSLPPDEGIDANNQCVKKNRGTTLFCIEPIDWPEKLRTKFVVRTILYAGPMAIVRYDQGAASRLHALFPATEFETIVNYYRERFGNPTELWRRSLAPLAEPRRDNPTVAWRSRDPKTNAVTILEIRKYDDTRGGFPDTGRGAVMLYLANSPAIFPQVSSHELMRLKREPVKKPG